MIKAINKKKWSFIFPLLAVVIAFVVVTPAFAQAGDPPTADQVNDITLSINVFWMILGGF